MASRPWNWNIHHQRVVLDAVPNEAATALDVGSGDGLLAFDLAARGLDVTGIDLDGESVERARADARATSTATTFVLGDLFDHPFEPHSFDVVASISMLHHVDATAGLRRMRELVRPGGTLVVVGFARPSTAIDCARVVVGGLVAYAMKFTGRYWEHNAPTVWPPPCTMHEMRGLVAHELPEARFRGLLPSRYAAVWSAPDPVL
ncbi:MAG TPA: class I SAM-dependent methyltransferase [Acidimicrobiia bacterium]|jgi:2-polyprenyl-3-methyl-5-hydroxy-6-metoxy-1,4-benzoquinol methylase